MYIKKIQHGVKYRTANGGTYTTTLRKQNSLVKPRREAADGLRGGKLPTPTNSSVRNRSAFRRQAFRLPPLGQALLKPLLGLLLGKAGLGRDEAQRGGIRVLVDLVEVVLQDLHLVLGGAARCVRRHGPGADGSGKGKPWIRKSSSLMPACLNSRAD